MQDDAIHHGQLEAQVVVAVDERFEVDAQVVRFDAEELLRSPSAGRVLARIETNVENHCRPNSVSMNSAPVAV